MRKLTHFLRSFVIATSLAAFVAPAAYADIILKQSTASQAVKLGPFVDSVDGNSEETALTIANTDIKCSKNGGTLASKNSGGATHDANGWYTATFDATDTNTVGRFQCFVHVAGALPVTLEANIVEEAIYDGIYGASAGTSTTILPVNTTQVAGTTQTGRDLGASVLLSSGTGTGQLSITSGVVNANQVQIAGTSVTTLTGGYPSLGIVDSGTAQAATGTTLQLRSAATFANSELNGAWVLITSATTGAGQTRQITGYVGSTDTATVPTWTTTPTGTITYIVLPSSLAASDVWANTTRELTALDEDNTVMDLNATTVGTATSVSGSVGSIASGGISEASFATTAGSFKPLGITDQGTAQASTGTTLQLRSAATFADDALNGATIIACGSTQGYCTSGSVTDYVGSTDTATVTFPVQPTGTITYQVFGTAVSAGTGGSGPDAATIADAVWDEARSGHVSAGSFGEYTNANVALFGGTAGTFTSGQPTVRVSNGTGTGQISLASGTVTSGTVNDKTGYGLSAAAVDAVWDEAQSGHSTGGTFGFYLDSAISGVSTGGVSAATIADAVWDEATAGHVAAGSTGERLTRIPNAAAGANGGLPTVNASNQIVGIQVLDEDTTTLDLNATPVGSVTSPVTVGTNNDKTGYALSTAGVNALRDVVIDDMSGKSLGCVMAALAAYTGGQVTTTGSVSTYRDETGAEIRITGTVISSGNRTATITCPTYP